MTSLPAGFWTPEKAAPLLRDPTFIEPVKLMATGPIEAIDLLNDIQVSLAFRLGCVSIDPETKVKHANVPVDGIRLWDTLMRQYDASCHTQPTHLFAEVDPTTKRHAIAQYTLPLAAYGKQAKAVIAKYDYSPRKPDKRSVTATRRLGRKVIEKIHLGSNPFYVPVKSAPVGELGNVTSRNLFDSAVRQGRASSTPI